MTFMDDLFGPEEIEHVTWKSPNFRKRLKIELFLSILMIPLIVWMSFCTSKQIIGFFPYIFWALVLAWIRTWVIDLGKRPELKKIFNLDFSSFKPGGRYY